MKEYHTTIEINASQELVWKYLTDFPTYPNWNPLVGNLTGKMQVGQKIATFIVPLDKTYFPTLLAFEPNKELTWQGSQGAKFLLAGKHYYILEAISSNKTKLLHGEYFTGILSVFISKTMLSKMENAFIKHNQILKLIIENEK